MLVAAPAAPASTGVGAQVQVLFPPGATVGDQGLPAALVVSTTNIPPHTETPNTVQQIHLIPSCGAFSNQACAPGAADPGAFTVSATGVGRSGTACAGLTFVSQVIDPGTGTVRFSTTQPVVLTSAARSCAIDFTIDVVSSPSIDVSPASPGVQTGQAAEVIQRTSDGQSALGRGTDTMTVVRATASVALASSANSPVVGEPVELVAQVSGNAASPTGSVLFRDGATVLGSVELRSGTARFLTHELAPGGHPITADYSGRGAYAAATSASLLQRVNYTDVPDGAAFYDDIYWFTDRELATGFADGSFRPANAVTRQAFAAHLYRYDHAGADAGPCAPGTSAFSDVPDSSPFCGDIAWLASTDVSGGFSDGTFRPTATVTRQAIAAFFYRYDRTGPSAGPCAPGTSAFSDVPDNSPFCGDIRWLASTAPMRITGGFADGTFRPTQSATRQAVSAYFHRYSDNTT